MVRFRWLRGGGRAASIDRLSGPLLLQRHCNRGVCGKASFSAFDEANLDVAMVSFVNIVAPAELLIKHNWRVLLSLSDAKSLGLSLEQEPNLLKRVKYLRNTR